MPKPIISYADFNKLDMRIGTIVECEGVEGSEKLLNLTVDLGAELGKRTIISGIKKDFEPEKLIGTQVLVLANLEPKKMMGLESQGMILMAVSHKCKVQNSKCKVEGENETEDEETMTLIVPQNKVPEGIGVE